jgi:hypothetical protein
MRPAVLFARADSIYKTMDCDVWDAERDAVKWPGGAPVVAHPPCRIWSNFAHMSNAPFSEKQLATFAIGVVRKFGGVLEHPAGSRLFSASAMPPGEGLPRCGDRDAWGGFQVVIEQWWFGHRAQKMTRLYICGCQPKDLPEIPIKLGEAPCVIGDVGRATLGTKRPEISKPEREATPPLFAEWLLEVARRCTRPVAQSVPPLT